MRFLDNDHATTTRNVALYLSREEALNFRDKLDWLLANPDEHFHLQDSDQKREISVSIYDDEVLNSSNRLNQYNQLEQTMFLDG